MNEKKDKTEIEGQLRDSQDTTGAWDRIRAGFVKQARAEGLIDVAYEIHASPFGPLVIASTDIGILRIGLSAESEDEVVEDLAKRASARILKASQPEITAARGQLDEYFEGQRLEFELDLDWQLTRGFRRSVLAAAYEIPYGETSSYRELATEAGSPQAVRAAGSALANNPLPIVIPCHRVLKSDGAVGNYLGGTQMKQRLLEMERTRASA